MAILHPKLAFPIQFLACEPRHLWQTAGVPKAVGLAGKARERASTDLLWDFECFIFQVLCFLVYKTGHMEPVLFPKL